MAPSATSQSARKTVSEHVKRHKKQGMPQKQAVAAALNEARRKGKKVAPKKKSSKSKGGSRKQKAKAGRKGGKATARKSKK